MSSLEPIEESEEKCSHDGYQLLHSNRIYVFYSYNFHCLKNHTLSRIDMQIRNGYYFRWSENGFHFYSDRYIIPVRRTLIDQKNKWLGEIMGMFMCDKPSIINGYL